MAELVRATVAPPDERRAPMVSDVVPRPRPSDRVAEMRELYVKGDTEGALAVAASIAPPDLAAAPGGAVAQLDDTALHIDVEFEPLASRPPGAALSLTERLSVPRVVKSPGEIAQLPLDHRAGFLLTHVDGMHTLEEILDVCAMPGSQALELFEKLKALGVIDFD